MKAILVQPPFSQLNSPYPAVHYLEAFLRGRGVSAVAFDHSIELYRHVLSRAGLAKVFADARAALDARDWAADARASRANAKAAARDPGADEAARGGALGLDEESRNQVERYFSYEALYVEWIDGIVDFLSGGDPAMAHRLASAAELPRGARAEAFLAERGGRIDPDEARALATRILDDLGDFIAYALDPDFGTVRYAERLASSRADFGEVRAALDSSWLMREFYAPMLEEFWSARLAEASSTEPIGLILVTIPFPGCLLGALACARAARRLFGGTGLAGPGAATPLRSIPSPAGPSAKTPLIVFGGGYVSTELRGLRDTGIFDFCDYLSFDAGYGSLASIMEREAAAESAAGGSGAAAAPAAVASASASALYRTMIRRGEGTLIVAGFPQDDSARLESGQGRSLVECGDAERFARIEREAVVGVFPDYRSADFKAYLRVVDSGNPMHRLWSDTPWLKYGLAHGCYWRRCSFCDTELEYVADFARTRTGALFDAAEKAGARTGLYGIHFVDEAMPMAALLDFARANRARAAAGARPFSFWGNVRFDSSWTQGRCEYLAASGLVAVSGGIEIATERGLEMTDKGFDLPSLVRTLVAMRRSGILVHAYLIYGFPGQPKSDIVDSAEFCRQLFASGLVDSAFWHRFVLTRHSRMYREWKEGKRPGLEPSDKAWSFANNDLAFKGEAAFDRFDAPLAASLASWMEGIDLEKPVSTWFGKSTSPASIAGDFAETLIASAEETLDEELDQALDQAIDQTPAAPGGTVHWVAGAPALKVDGPGKAGLTWAYRGELRSLELQPAVAKTLVAVLSSPGFRASGMPRAELFSRLALSRKAWAELFTAGLVLV